MKGEIHMEVNKKNPEGYMDLTAFKAIKKAEPKEHTYRPLIYVCSPGADRARDYGRYVVDKGGLPMAPGLYLQQFLGKEDEEMDLAQFFSLECRSVSNKFENNFVYLQHKK